VCKPEQHIVAEAAHELDIHESSATAGQMSLVNDHVLHLKLQFQVAAFASFIL